MHQVEWTPEKIARFWNYYSSNRALDDTYFTKLVGHSIVRFAERRIRLGRVLDLGCGHGDLIGHLIAKHQVAGADQSSGSVDIVVKRFANDPHFLWAKVGAASFPDAAFDTVFIVEVVEHLDDEKLAETLSEARRLLKPGGHLVVTTPNDENLDAHKRICPDCGCVFHQMQHVRSWTAATLAPYIERFGFETAVCEPTLFSRYRGMKAVLDRLRYGGRKLPHLAYVGHRVSPAV
jgi:SAM-dependent methyltransferase